MEGLEVFWQVLMGICAGIIALGGTVSVIAKVWQPWRQLAQAVESHERKLESDNKDIAGLVEGQRIQNRCMLQLLNHMIDGNHTAQLKNERDALQTYLIEK